jgi:uncharacterized protein YcbX
LPNDSRPAGSANVQIWKDTVFAYEMIGGTTWLSHHFNPAYKLMRFSTMNKRVDRKGYDDDNIQIMFQDTSQCLVINQASVDYLNSRMVYPVQAEAYRGNIVVSGPEAFAEDSWQTLKVVGKEIYLIRIGLCRRCEITQQDVHTGVTRGKEPLATLGKLRKLDCVYRNGEVKNGAAFGVYFEVMAEPGTIITQNDKFEVIKRVD